MPVQRFLCTSSRRHHRMFIFKMPQNFGVLAQRGDTVYWLRWNLVWKSKPMVHFRKPILTLIGEGVWVWEAIKVKSGTNWHIFSPPQGRHDASIRLKFVIEEHTIWVYCRIPNFPWSVRACGYGSLKNSNFGMCGYPAGFAKTRRCLLLYCIDYGN